MDNHTTAKIILVFMTLLLVSCGSSDKKHPDVDNFYVQKRFGQQFALVPLAKPIKLAYDTDLKNWGFYPSSDFFGFSLYNADATTIGVHGNYVYGKVDQEERTFDDIEDGKIIIARKEGGAKILTDSRDKSSKIIKPIKGKSKTYLLPERWFIINTTEGKGEGFFDKDEYLKTLQRKDIKGKMYNSDSLLKTFQNTGVLEFFPDSIKTKLTH